MCLAVANYLTLLLDKPHEIVLRLDMEVQITASKDKSALVRNDIKASSTPVPVERLFPLFELMFAELKSADHNRHEGEAKENETRN